MIWSHSHIIAAVHGATGATGTTGTAVGDVPTIGSVIETTTFGDSGFGNVYFDLASATPGGDVISDTVLTPFGDFTIPSSLDAAAGLAVDMFASY